VPESDGPCARATRQRQPIDEAEDGSQKTTYHADGYIPKSDLGEDAAVADRPHDVEDE
jgi:hypothetical protein